MAARHVLLIVADLLSVFLFSGVIFGWAPLNDMLLKEGFYADQCKDVPAPCEAQRTALNRAFTLASTAVSIAALPGGSFVDACGPMLASAVAGALNLIGLAGIALCKHYGSDHLDVFLISFVVLAVGGSLTMFCGYSLPFLFPKRCTLLIELTSCLFDASCIIFPIFKIFYDMNVEFGNLFWYYSCLCLANFVALVIAWGLNNRELWASRAGLGGGSGEGGGHGQVSELQSWPLGRQLRTVEFLAILAFAAVQVARSNLYLGAVDLVNDQIAESSHADAATLSRMSTIIGLIVPQGWLAVPAIELSIHKLGILGTMHVTTVIGLVYNGLQLVPNLPLQLVGAIVFAMFRAFLFSIITAYNAETFGPKTLGRIMGVCFLAAAIVNLAQTPLVQMSLQTLKGDFTPLTIGSMVVTLPMPLLVLAVWCKQRGTRRREGLLASPYQSARSRLFSRAYSHSTAACTATHLRIAEQIERTLEADAAARQAQCAPGENDASAAATPK